MDQSARNQLLRGASLREMVEMLDDGEGKPCDVVWARISRLFNDLLTRLGLFSDYPSC